MFYNRKGEQVDRIEWSIKDRRVAETTLPDGRWVSTVFLGIDYSFGDGPPVLFETMVFSSKMNRGGGRCERYSTESEAKAGHKRIVREETKRGKRK